MMTIFFRTLKDRKFTLLVYCLAMLFFIWLYVAMFPSMEKAYAEMMKSFPSEWIKAMGVEPEKVSTFSGFMSEEYFSQFLPIILIVFSISFSGFAVAQEVEKGTSEILLSQPISRLRILYAKFLAGVVNLAVFVFFATLAIIPMAKLVSNISVDVPRYISTGFFAFVLGVAIMSISFLFSAIFTEKGKANFVPSGILVIMYVFSIFSGINKDWEVLRYFSFFYYFDATEILVDNNFDLVSLAVLLGVIVFSCFLTAYIFNKKDISR